MIQASDAHWSPRGISAYARAARRRGGPCCSPAERACSAADPRGDERNKPADASVVLRRASGKRAVADRIPIAGDADAHSEAGAARTVRPGQTSATPTASPSSCPGSRRVARLRRRRPSLGCRGRRHARRARRRCGLRRRLCRRLLRRRLASAPASPTASVPASASPPIRRRSPCRPARASSTARPCA